MDGLKFVQTYLDDCLVLTNRPWEDHLNKLARVLERLREAGLKMNANKSYIEQSQLEYLSYWIPRQGIQPLPKKVDAIKNIAPPTKRKELRSFIGMVNYHLDMWIHRSDVLASLTALTSTTMRWEWTPLHQQAFEQTKALFSREVLLTFPDFSQPFEIHTDASALQLCAVVAQNKKPIAFSSRKLNPAQRRYTTTEREFLAIVETLKEFLTILLGYTIRVFTDYKNLTYAHFNADRFMR
jgi:hypothetical protein